MTQYELSINCSLTFIVIKYFVENKGFAEMTKNINAPDNVIKSEKPLKEKNNKTSRVDINVLKSKLQESENKEFKKNIFLLSFLILVLAAIGIYLSL